MVIYIQIREYDRGISFGIYYAAQGEPRIFDKLTKMCAETDNMILNKVWNRSQSSQVP